MNAILRRFAELGVDYECGTKLLPVLRDRGLAHVDGAVWTPVIASATAGMRVFENARPIVWDMARSRGWATDADLATIDALASAPNLPAGTTPCVLCWGQRP